jgi:hypothetical protein
MRSPHRTRAVLKAKKTNILFLLMLAKAIHAGFSANPTLLPSPPVQLAVLLDLIQKLDDAQQNLKKIGAAARNVARDALYTALESLRMYVQELCDAGATPEQAAALITAAGMKVALVGSHPKPVIGVKLILPAGSVAVSANAGLLCKSGKKKTFFNWQFTTDGGKSWNGVPSTPDAHTTIANLPLLTVCGFRVSITDTAGAGAWSEMVTILVH